MSVKDWRFMRSGAETCAMADAVRSQVQTFVPGKQLLAGIRPIACPNGSEAPTKEAEREGASISC